jgi:hypothetical protein
VVTGAKAKSIAAVVARVAPVNFFVDTLIVFSPWLEIG